jgi:beta-glucosidase
MSIMTSYNLINGIPTADSYDLCTNIARGEWGFDGLIMTDWNGGKSTPSISMHAGNDLIMPGGSGRIREIVLAATIKPPVFDERGQVEFYEERMFITFLRPNWN